jgi:hypothetical protein
MSTPAVLPSPEVSPESLPATPAPPDAPAVPPPPAAPQPAASASATVVEVRELAMWQRKLLPFMIRFIIATAVAFFLLTGYNVYQMQQFISSENSGNLAGRVEKMVHAGNSTQILSSGESIQQSLLVLEAAAMESRYRQASGLLMSRIWTRQLAFLTGMVLAFLGSVFILGTDALKGAISSASPGLILAFFGTCLMAIALVIQQPIQVQDRPLYFGTLVPAPGPIHPQQIGPASSPGTIAANSLSTSGKIGPSDANSAMVGGSAPTYPLPSITGSKPPTK